MPKHYWVLYAFLAALSMSVDCRPASALAPHAQNTHEALQIPPDGGVSVSPTYRSISATVSTPMAIQPHWRAEYTDGPTCWWEAGSSPDACSKQVRCTEEFDGAISKNWGNASPQPDLGSEWVGKFRTTVTFPPGDYVFHARHNDGVKVYLSQDSVIDNLDNIMEGNQNGGEQWTCPPRFLSGSYDLLVVYVHWQGTADAYLYMDWSHDVSPCATSTPTPTLTPTLIPTPTPTSSAKTWTFMLYLAGDNNLYPYLERALADLEAQPENPNVTVAVLYDGDRSNDSWRYIMQPGGNYTYGVNKWHMGELNMGDPQTLSSFVLWAREAAPAQNHYLAIADHGRGTSGLAWDNGSGSDYLSVRELQTALNVGTNAGQSKLDVLHLDACLMAMFENAYQVEPYADYLVASQNLGWSVFAYTDYTGLQSEKAPAPLTYAMLLAKMSAAPTPRQLALSIAEAYYHHPSLVEYPRTISALDLSQARAVREALDALCARLQSSLPTYKTSLQNARSAAQKFDSRDYYKITAEDEYLDLYDLGNRLYQYIADQGVRGAAQTLMQAISSLVMVEYHESGTFDLGGTQLYWDLEDSHGVSIYFPMSPGGYDYNDYINHASYVFTADSRWDDLLKDYYGILGLPPVDSTDPGLPPFLQPTLYRVRIPYLVRSQ